MSKKPLITIPDVGYAEKLFLETGVDEFPYRFCGTGFLINYKDSKFLVTLKHCVSPNDYQNLFVPSTDLGDSSIVFDEVFTPQGDPSKDGGKDFSDLILLKCKKGSVKRPTFRIESHSIANPLSMIHRRVFFRGYPGNLCDILYSEKKIKKQALSVEVSDISADTMAEHCYKASFLKTDKIDSLAGASGSPVFQVEANKELKLIGIVHQGGKTEWFHFIGAEVLWSILRGGSYPAPSAP